MFKIVMIMLPIISYVALQGQALADVSKVNRSMGSMTSKMSVKMSPSEVTAHTLKAQARRTSHIVHRVVDAPSSTPLVYLGGHAPVMDRGRWFHGILNEFEGRYQAGGQSSLRWSGDMWYGSDYHRLWLKSEGTVTRGQVHDGTHEILYSRAISPYFNLQSGVRLDIDSGPIRPWGTLGIEGLSLYQFDVRLAGYFSGRGVAAKLEGSYDILLTNRLILQPSVELNAYSQSDPRRGVGSGISDIDTGLRLRYEIWRKFAPYIAVTYDSPLFKARRIARENKESAAQARFTFGIRSWF